MAGGAQVFWHPGMGCKVRSDISTHFPDYDLYLNGASWAQRRVLRVVGDDGTVAYPTRDDRVWPDNALSKCIKIKPDNVPLFPRQQDQASYFAFAEMEVLNVLEGQLALLSHVCAYEDSHNERFLSDVVVWKYQFLCCCFGALSKELLEQIRDEIRSISQLAWDHGSWFVKDSKAMSGILRHGSPSELGRYMELPLEGLQQRRIKPFDWAPAKFFAFIMANTKGRFQIWCSPAARASKACGSSTSTLGSLPSKATPTCLGTWTRWLWVRSSRWTDAAILATSSTLPITTTTRR